MSLDESIFEGWKLPVERVKQSIKELMARPPEMRTNECIKEIFGKGLV